MNEADKQVVKDEKSAEQRFVAEKAAAAKRAFDEQMSKGRSSAPVGAMQKRRSVAEVIAEWAAGLTPRLAPPQAEKGPLAWVRETKAKELIALLAKEGHQ